jgi:hypothetical protein
MYKNKKSDGVARRIERKRTNVRAQKKCPWGMTNVATQQMRRYFDF